MNLCLELVADVCSCISGFHAVLLMTLVLYFEVFGLLSVTWKSCTKMSTMMNLHFMDLMEAYHSLAV